MNADGRAVKGGRRKGGGRPTPSSMRAVRRFPEGYLDLDVGGAVAVDIESVDLPVTVAVDETRHAAVRHLRQVRRVRQVRDLDVEVEVGRSIAVEVDALGHPVAVGVDERLLAPGDVDRAVAVEIEVVGQSVAVAVDQRFGAGRVE